MIPTLASLLPADLVEQISRSVWLLILFKVALAATVFLAGVSLIAMFSIWWERKVAGHMQGRLGPMHTGGWHGWSQSIADGIKLILKEDLIPEGADHFLFRLAPYLAFAPVFAAFAVLPFGPQLVFEGAFENALLYILAVLAVEILAVILAGWGSNSKWAIYGAMREACQLVSYEVPLTLCLVCGILVSGTLSLVEMGHLQAAGIWDWFAFHNPFIFLAFGLYFVAGLAENKRAPFDLPESESELVAGFHTEYSGLRFSFFFFAEYAGMFVLGVIMSFLFLGGWNSPLGMVDPVHLAVGYDPIEAGRAYFAGTVSEARGAAATAAAMGLAESGNGWLGTPGWLSLVVVNLYGLFWVAVKAFGAVFVQMWLRWTLPRIRIDQVMYACVKVLLPAALIALVGTAAWVAIVPQPQAEPIRLGHLAGQVPLIQAATQGVLTLAGLAVVAACVVVVLHAFLTREKHPRRSMFEDVMPVGREIAFTGRRPEVGGEAGNGQPQPSA